MKSTLPGSKKPSSGGGSSPSVARRRNSRILHGFVGQRPQILEAFFESASPEEVMKIFDGSYPWTLANVLIDLKKSTSRRLLEFAVRNRKRAFTEVATLYYYKDYLTNPFPLDVLGTHNKRLPNFYAILGVGRESSHEEIKNAYKLLEAAFSEESFAPAERGVGEARLREMTQAYEELKEPKRRKEIDTILPAISYLYPRRDQSWLFAVLRLLAQ